MYRVRLATRMRTTGSWLLFRLRKTGPHTGMSWRLWVSALASPRMTWET